MVERIVTVDLGDGMRIAASAEQQGPQLVADESVVAKLTAVTTPIEKVSRDILEAVKRASPSRLSHPLIFEAP